MPASPVTIDTSAASALAVCACGWRGPVYRRRAQAKAAGDDHRELIHPELGPVRSHHRKAATA